jgi:aspartyl-tRNA(Asn)/glutamyl-tRNA(Gln) amidotransferase subunit C
MRLSPQEVRHVAALARLEFAPAEEEVLTLQLDHILQFVEKLNEVDTNHVEPMAHVMDIVNAFRDDTVVNRPAPDLLLSNAPEKHGNFFKVPKILE